MPSRCYAVVCGVGPLRGQHVRPLRGQGHGALHVRAYVQTLSAQEYSLLSKPDGYNRINNHKTRTQTSLGPYVATLLEILWKDRGHDIFIFLESLLEI